MAIGVGIPSRLYYMNVFFANGALDFRAYASYSLWKGNVTVAVGHKMGFCMEDSVCPPDRTPKFNCDIQGISAGCADLYYATLACQWIDVTDLVSLPSFDRDQELELRVTVNHDGKFPETNIGNNEAKVKFRMSGLQEFSSNVWRQPRHGEVPEACEKARPNAAAKV